MKEDPKVTEYRMEVDRFVQELADYVESADIQGYEDTFAKEEVEAMRSGAIAALQTVSVVVLGSCSKAFGIDPQRGLRERPKDVAEFTMKSAAMAHKICVLDKE